MATTATYFRNFFAEKEIDSASWQIDTADGNTHLIDSDFVITLIKGTRGEEARSLMRQLTMIDFANAPTLPFLERLARAYVANS